MSTILSLKTIRSLDRGGGGQRLAGTNLDVRSVFVEAFLNDAICLLGEIYLHNRISLLDCRDESGGNVFSYVLSRNREDKTNRFRTVSA